MFNDELERALLEERQSSMSIQAWAAQVAKGAHQRPALWRRLLRGFGSSLIAFGSNLIQRFDEPDRPLDDYIPNPHDRAFN